MDGAGQVLPYGGLGVVTIAINSPISTFVAILFAVALILLFVSLLFVILLR